MAFNPMPNLKSQGFQAPMPTGQALVPTSVTPATSVIGADLTILGEHITIISQNRIQIEGDVRGDVSGREVTISGHGSVIGTVSAERIEVHGGVQGAIRAASVVVHPTANLDAEIVHEKLSIAEGAHVEGRLRRAKDANELKPNLDPSSYISAPRQHI